MVNTGGGGFENQSAASAEASYSGANRFGDFNYKTGTSAAAVNTGRALVLVAAVAALYLWRKGA